MWKLLQQTKGLFHQADILRSRSENDRHEVPERGNSSSDELRPIQEHEAVALLESAKTPEGWNGFVDKILRSYKGVYPDYWVRVIIESGLMKRVTDKF